jgi:hypothetical protein
VGGGGDGSREASLRRGRREKGGGGRGGSPEDRKERAAVRATLIRGTLGPYGPAALPRIIRGSREARAIAIGGGQRRGQRRGRYRGQRSRPTLSARSSRTYPRGRSDSKIAGANLRGTVHVRLARLLRGPSPILTRCRREKIPAFPRRHSPRCPRVRLLPRSCKRDPSRAS